ncbi:MAG: L-threonylcarbamoyladenylate synthase, partial [Blastocatellia bacterium]
GKCDTDSVERVVDCLSTGGIVLLATDTVYGLAVLPTYEQSVNRVYSLKGRPRDVNLPVMISSPTVLASLGFEVNERAACLLRSRLVPGPLTLAMGFRSGPRPRWLDGRVEAAIRIPDDDWLLSVLKRSGPLLVTSANSHGLETPETVTDVLAQLHGAPDLAVDGGSVRTVPSTLVNCRCDPPVVERIGAIPEAEVMAYLK